MNRKVAWLISLIFFWFSPKLLLAQREGQARIDSILQKLPGIKQDTNRVNAYDELTTEYTELIKTPNKTDPAFIKALYYAQQGLQLGIKIKSNKGIVYGYCGFADAYLKVKDIEQALTFYKKGYASANNRGTKQDVGDKLINAYTVICKSYIDQAKLEDAFKREREAISYFESAHNKTLLARIYNSLAVKYRVSNKEKAIAYNQKSLSFFKPDDNSADHIKQLVNMANVYRNDHDLVNALTALQLAQKLLGDGKNAGIADGVYVTLSNLYDDLGEYAQSAEIRKKAVETTTVLTTKILVILSLSKDYLMLKRYDKAFYYDNVALGLAKEAREGLIPNVQIEMALGYYLQKKYNAALSVLNDAGIMSKTGAGGTGPPRLSNAASELLADLYRDAPDSLLKKYGINNADKYSKAQQLYTTILQANKSRDNIQGQSDIYESLNLLYEKMKDLSKAYDAYKSHVALRDSLAKLTNKSAVLRQGLEYAYKQREDSIKFKQLITSNKLKNQLQLNDKEKELQQAKLQQSHANLQAEQNKRKANEQQLIAAEKDEQLQKTVIKDKQTQSYYLFGGIAGLLGLSFFVTQNYRNQKKSNSLLMISNKLVTAEKQRSDDLLLNILPADVAEELKEKGASEARLFDEVTVLFTDFVNFTHLSELLTPKELVEELNVCFKAFDGIMTTHGIEKIKTIGDAYLAVAGLPHADANHALNTVNAAQDIQQFIKERRLKLGDKTFDIRIGIHSGSVVAGIVGVKKFAYDIWGDTVNTAARMEQNSEPGKINVSEKTYELVKDKFTFTYRGEIEAKNKGALKMFFVEG